jgi:hypothetical protein
MVCMKEWRIVTEQSANLANPSAEGRKSQNWQHKTIESLDRQQCFSLNNIQTRPKSVMTLKKKIYWTLEPDFSVSQMHFTTESLFLIKLIKKNLETLDLLCIA